MAEVVGNIFPDSSPPAGGGRSSPVMYYIYVIYNLKHKKIYIGQTNNLDRRIELHNSKAFKNCYTSRFDGEWKLIYKEEVETRKIAILREKQLKSYRGREYIKQYIPR